MKKKTCALIFVLVGWGINYSESPFGDGSFGNEGFDTATHSLTSSPFSAHDNPSSTFGQPESHASSSSFGSHESLPSAKTQHEVTQSRSVMSGSYEAKNTTNGAATGQESAQQAKEQTMIEEEVDTFDTTGSGNWVLKRVWWEKTETVYEQIKQVFNDIMNSRMEFINHRNSLERELDVFYGQMGLDEGPLQTIIDRALDVLKKDKTATGFLNKKEREFSVLVSGKDHDFEQLKLNIEALKDLDQKIDEALDALFGQIDTANRYEQKAWENFKDIARELDDKIARKTYYDTEALLKDIKAIKSYITDEFAAYFTQTIQSAEHHAKSIHAQMYQLKQQGIDLKKQLEDLEKACNEPPVDIEKEEREKKAQQAALKKKMEEQSGFFGSITSFFSSITNSITNFFSSIISSVKGLFIKEEAVVVVKKQLKSDQLEKEHEKKFSEEQSDVRTTAVRQDLQELKL